MLLPAIVVLADDLAAGAAQRLLFPYADSATAVVSRRAGPELFWYSFPVGQIRASVDAASPDARLRGVLGLDGLTPIATWQVSAGAPPPGDAEVLLLDGEQVVGLLPPAAPPSVAAAPPAASIEEERGAWQGRDQIGFKGTGSGAEKQPFDVVRVFYGTDRRGEPDLRVAPYYGSGRGELTFGMAQVSIPSRRPKGTLPRPAWWRLEFREDPARHVMIAEVEPLPRDEFVLNLRATFKDTGVKHALLFVHGYNVTFADAVRRTAQLACDLRTSDAADFPGLPLLYSWPSQGKLLGYMTDETNVEWTLPHFEQFLRVALIESGADVVHLIAHSMGSRALIKCLCAFDASTLPPGSARLEQVILAAPDFDAGTFRNLADALTRHARRCTLYASSADQALRASRELRSDLPRAGESGEHLLVVKGIDTIDASQVDTSLLGHGYFGERTVLGDIYYLLRDGRSPNDRYGLKPMSDRELPYWEFVP